jgi:chromosome segregation ATPase
MPNFFDRLRPHAHGPALLRRSGRTLADSRAQLERLKNHMARIDKERTRLLAEREELAGNPSATGRLEEIDRDLRGLDLGGTALREALTNCEESLSFLEDAQRQAQTIQRNR